MRMVGFLCWSGRVASARSIYAYASMRGMMRMVGFLYWSGRVASAGLVPHVCCTHAHGICWAGAPCVLHARTHAASAGLVPYGLWIIHACAPHACVRACATRTHARMPHATRYARGACWAGAPWVVDHACMCATHARACMHTHTHVHTRSGEHLLPRTHRGRERLLGWYLVGCGSCMHMHHMHTTYICAWHAHTCTCNTLKNHTACGCCMHVHLELYYIMVA